MGKTLNTVVFTAAGMMAVYIVASNFGNKLITGIEKRNSQKKTEVKMVVASDYSDQIKEGILDSMATAKKAAEEYASEQLDLWVEDIMSRVDGGFLDEYFSFANVKYREFKSVGKAFLHKINSNWADSVEDVIKEELEEKILKELVRPEISQARIENIMKGTVDIYLDVFDSELKKLQEKFRIPTPEWKDYVSDICGIILDVKTKKYPLSFKAISVSAFGIAGIPVIKVVMKNVSKKIMLKSGGKLAMSVGGKAIASNLPVVGLGITAAIGVWDLIDYKVSAEKGKKELRRNIEDYFKEVKDSMMINTEGTITGCLTEWENRLKQNIASRD